VHRIAYGGMAEIYLARASGIEGFEKYVVLKRILPQYAASEEFVRMFLREARLAATLDQANIAHVYDIGETGGTYFFTMEYLHGEDVRIIMRRLLRDGGRLPLEHAVMIAVGAATGLHFAHEKKGSDGRSLGIVHRDMSPSNVVVTYDGGVKVVDFGVAKMAADPELSKRYALKGKLAYMSPEQLNNRPLDRRSDLFSLGIVLYEMTTHTRLFKGQTEVETMRMVLEAVVPPPSKHDPEYPHDLERIVMRALAKDPDKRYASARELQRDLEAFARDQRWQLSSAGLAEWMEKTFGPKREIWHTLPAAPALALSPDPAPARRGDEDGRVQTRIVSHAALAAPATASDSTGGDRSGATPATLSALPSAAARGSSSAGRIGTAVGLGGLVALAGIGLTFLLTRGHPIAASSVAAAAPARSPVVMLVAEGGAVALEPPAAAPSEKEAGILTAPLPAAAAPLLSAAVAAPAEPSGRRRGRRPAANPAAAFTAAVARRHDEIHGCFAKHAGGDGPDAGQISLRFEVGASGGVVSVSVLPAPIGATPLGRCLAEVGARTVFAPQPAPVAFRIPLTLERRRSAREP
jgi:tRNA A-37 threonylcarbamoyl transferase component Bud32